MIGDINYRVYAQMFALTIPGESGTPRRLKQGEVLVLSAIHTVTHFRVGRWQYGQVELAEITGQSVRAVRTAIKSLATGGLISITHGKINENDIYRSLWRRTSGDAKASTIDAGAVADAAGKEVASATKMIPVGTNPPTVEDVAAYIGEKGYYIDAQRFVAVNSARGWEDKRGRPYYDWRAVVDYWASYDRQRQAATPPVQGTVQDTRLISSADFLAGLRDK